MSEAKVKNIHQAMIAVGREVEAIEKSNTNREQGFKFRGIDDVYASLHGLMAKHGIVTAPSVIGQPTFEIYETRNGGKMTHVRMLVLYKFIAEDGTFVEVGPVLGVGADTGDKYGNKALAIAHKYALLQLWTVPTEEDKDPDAHSHEVTGKADTQKPQPPAPKKPEASAKKPEPVAPPKNGPTPPIPKYVQIALGSPEHSTLIMKHIQETGQSKSEVGAELKKLWDKCDGQEGPYLKKVLALFASPAKPEPEPPADNTVAPADDNLPF